MWHGILIVLFESAIEFDSPYKKAIHVLYFVESGVCSGRSVGHGTHVQTPRTFGIGVSVHPCYLDHDGNQHDLFHTHVRIRGKLPVLALWLSCWNGEIRKFIPSNEVFQVGFCILLGSDST